MAKSRKKKVSRRLVPRGVVKPAATSVQIIKPDDLVIGKYKISGRRLFWISLTLMGVFMLFGALQVGVPADEPIDYAYGVSCVYYFTSLGKDTTYSALKVNNVNFPDQKYYGAAFEMIAPLINAIFLIKNPFPTHHILCAFAGIVLLLYTGLIAQLMKGWRAGLLALWIIFLTPIVTGNAFFNSKDIPFAAAFAAGIYYFVLYFQDPPKISRAASIGIALSVATAVSIRISGILLPAYIALFALGWYMMHAKQNKGKVKFFSKYLLNIALMLGGGTMLALLTYPNFWHEGLKHIAGGLAVTRKFQHNIYMLYENNLVSSQKINTGSYLARYFFMSVPELVLIAFIFSTVVLIIYRNRFEKGFNWMLLFGAIFPIAYVVLIKAPVYNGWRHLMFIYPFIVVVTALGINELFLLVKAQTTRYIASGILMIAMIDLFVWQIRAFPYNYVYYNHLSGGLSSIYKRYDTDYQQLSTYEGVNWLLKNEKDLKKPVTILSNNPSLRYEYDSTEVKFRYVAIKDMWLPEWDYAVVSTIFLNDKTIEAMFPPYGTIHTVERFSVPLTFVVKRPSREDEEAYRMIKNDSLTYASSLIDHVYQTNKTNTMAWYWKGCVLFQQGKYSESLQLARNYDHLFPGQDYIYELMAYDYYRLNQFNDALKFLGPVYKKKPGRKVYAQMIGDCLMKLGREQEAQYYYDRAK